jgi:DNA-binding FadR family transcriptional regulator
VAHVSRDRRSQPERSVKKPVASVSRAPATGRTRADRAQTGDSGGVAVPALARRKRRVLKTSELIAREIILDIAERGLKEGDTLPSEARMLKHYEVGRASLREALRLLEVQGLVRIRTGARGGPVVGAATAEHLARMLTLFFGLAGATYENLTAVMLIIFPKIAEIAARGRLSRAETLALQASVERSCAAPNPRLIRMETLADFHSLLPALERNPVWSLLTDAINLIFTDHVMTTSDSRDFHATTVVDHERIAKAILARDPTLAKQLMREHTERIVAFYRRQNPAIFANVIEWR